MDKPTEAQKIEFWERCGFYLEDGENYMDGTSYKVWHYPHSISDYGYAPNPPRIPIDLNNLFKYAVPKAIDKIMAEQECSSDLAYAILFKKWLQKLELDIPQYETTLFATIWEVIHG